MGDFLFANPSFLSGIGRVLDLGGAFDDYNDSPTPEIADERALRADWCAVGRDLEHALSDAPNELTPPAIE